MTLHEAIQKVLKKHNRPMTAKEIADEINKLQLYIRADGNVLPASQIHIRVQNYPTLFSTLENGEITLKRNAVRNLLEVAQKLNQISMKWYGYNTTILNINVIIPFYFFFRRMVDNPELMQKHFGFSGYTSDNSDTGILAFINALNFSSKPFNKKLTEISHDFLVLISNHELDKFESEFTGINLSIDNYSIKDFGNFFNKYIYFSTNQNIKMGQFSTPETIGKLMYLICTKDIYEGVSIYNPAAGFSTIPSLFAQNSEKKFRFSGEEINTEIYVLSAMNLIANDIDASLFVNANSFVIGRDNHKSDLVVCVPPFAKKIHDQKLVEKYAIHTTDITVLFVQLVLLKMKENGKSVILVPDGLLFNSKKDFKNLRKYILDEHLLEAVISLPAGLLLPFSGVKTSLIVLSKKYNSKVLFIDGENRKLYSTDDKGMTNLNINEICNIYSQKIDTDNPSKPEFRYGDLFFTSLDFEKIQSSEVNLIPKRYLLKESIKNEDNKEELRKVLQSYKTKPFSKTTDLKYVNITDLNNVYHDIDLNYDELGIINERQKGKVIETPVLLIASISPNLKPTFYDQKKGPIIISNNIYPFKVETDLIDIEYIIFELSTLEVKEQVIAMAKGVTSLKRISASDIFNIRIKVPPIEEQKKIVRLHKESLYSRKISDADKLAEKIGITAKSEKELLGFLKHEIENITEGISGDIVNLKNFMVNSSIDLELPITTRKNASKVIDVFGRLKSNIIDIQNLLTNIKSIIQFGVRQTKKTNVSFRKYFKGEAEKLQTLIAEKNVQLIIGVHDDYSDKSDKEILLDPEQFSLLIRNFVVNSIIHGFAEFKSEKVIVIHLYTDQDFYYLSFINNGIPFPEGFTLDDFLSFGGRLDNTKGSGLGGYLMGKIIDAHRGTIELMESGKALFLDGPIKEPQFIRPNFISTGVHFLIKLPKE